MTAWGDVTMVPAEELAALRAENAALHARAEAAEARLAPIEALAREIAPLHEAATGPSWAVVKRGDVIWIREADWIHDFDCPAIARVFGLKANARLIAALRNGAAAIITAGTLQCTQTRQAPLSHERGPSKHDKAGTP